MFSSIAGIDVSLFTSAVAEISELLFISSSFVVFSVSIFPSTIVKFVYSLMFSSIARIDASLFASFVAEIAESIFFLSFIIFYISIFTSALVEFV